MGTTGHSSELARKHWIDKLDIVCQCIVPVAHLPIAFASKVRLIEGSADAAWRFVPLSCPYP
eukprot:1764183-Amphidinium_carterae.1